MRKILTIVAFLATIISVGQNNHDSKSKVKIIVTPSDAILHLNGQKIILDTTRTLSLDSGLYEVKAWAPKRKLITKKNHLKSQQNRIIGIGLPFSEGFRKHQKRTIVYNVKKKLMRGGPIVLTSGFFLYSAYSIYNSRRKMKIFEQNMSENRVSYNNATTINTAASFRNEFLQNKEEFEKAKSLHNFLVVATPIVVSVGTITSIWSIKKAKKLKKPVYKEKPLLANVLYGVSNNHVGGLSFHLKLVI